MCYELNLFISSPSLLQDKLILVDVFQIYLSEFLPEKSDNNTFKKISLLVFALRKKIYIPSFSSVCS